MHVTSVETAAAARDGVVDVDVATSSAPSRRRMPMLARTN